MRKNWNDEEPTKLLRQYVTRDIICQVGIADLGQCVCPTPNELALSWAYTFRLVQSWNCRQEACVVNYTCLSAMN
jgi:hypothetical protein